MDWKLEVVVVPVADVDRAKHFYAEQLGFAVDHDTSPGENTRIVQLTPPGSACSIVIGQGVAEGTPGTLHGLQLIVDDIAAAHEHLAGNGVDIGPVQHIEADGSRADGPGGPWNSFLFFADPDGNSWVVQERP